MKYRRVNLENNAVKTRVAQINGGLAILKAVGFKQEGTELFMESVNIAAIENAI